MSKFTPGPWEVDGYSILASDACIFEGFLPFDKPKDKAEAEMRANLRAVAAVPEMVELLDAVVLELDNAAFHVPDEDKQDVLELRDKITALLERIGDESA